MSWFFKVEAQKFVALIYGHPVVAYGNIVTSKKNCRFQIFLKNIFSRKYMNFNRTAFLNNLGSLPVLL